MNGLLGPWIGDGSSQHLCCASGEWWWWLVVGEIGCLRLEKINCGEISFVATTKQGKNNLLDEGGVCKTCGVVELAE